MEKYEKENEKNDILFQEITPLLSAALASNVSAMRLFALSSDEKRRNIVDQAANINTKKDMRRYLKKLK